MKKERSEYLDAAIAIGDQMLAQKEVGNGYSWKTMGLGAESKVEWHKGDGLYSGVAGIVYFYMELYKRTEDEKYLDAVKQGAIWIEQYCKDNTTDYYAFFTGRMGVAYLFVLLADFLEDKSYLDKAVEVTRGCESFLALDQQIDDLINGCSGAILGLLHVYDATKDEEVLKNIHAYIDHLIDRISFGKKGFYWDRSSKNINGLCGFSHGASGIGYVFLELGHYFQNDTFYEIAEEAFAYENYWYDSEKGNWPDLRKGFFDEKTLEEFKQEYLEGNLDFFTTPGNMAAWCHGAPGIGLSRVRAYEILGKEQYLEDAKRAVAQTMHSTVEIDHEHISYIICHGGGGNAILFLEYDRLVNGSEYYESAAKVAKRGIEYFAKHNSYISGFSLAGQESDTSLFMGNAGIGYYYLLVHDGGLSEPSLLKPDVNSVFTGQKDGILSLDSNELKLRLFKKLFPMLSNQIKSNLDMTKVDLSNGYLDGLLSYAKDVVSSLDNKKASGLLEHEYGKCTLDLDIKSHSYLNIQSMMRIDSNQKLLGKSDDDLLKQLIVKPEEFKLKAFEPGIISDDSDDSYLILIPGSAGIVEFPLTFFSYAVLQKFENPRSVGQVLDEMVEEFDVETEDDIKQVRDATFKQIKEAAQQGILCEPESVHAD